MEKEKTEQKIKALIDFCQGLYRRENVKELYQKYLPEIQSVTPQEIMLVQYEQLKMGLTPKEILSFVDKLINVIHKPLGQYAWKRPRNGTFLHILMEENKELIKRLDGFKAVIKQGGLLQQGEAVRAFVRQLAEYDGHLLKLENILFPYMEKRMERYNGLRIMWSLHDEVRKQWKGLIAMLEKRTGHSRGIADEQHRDGCEALDEQALNAEIGQLYFNLYGLVQKQELILFPCAAELFGEDDFAEMHRQSFDYGFPFIDRPKLPNGPEAAAERADTARERQENGQARPDAKGRETRWNRAEGTGGLRKLFKTDTGHLDFEQLDLLLNALPVDLTFVDEQDRVAWFSRPKDRIFPRSAAVIGLDVRNCHPPESVHVVDAILNSFRTGRKEDAEFWIQLKGRFLYIRYAALRDSKNNYRGTLEITQDISGLRALEGQKRLLDW